MCTCRPPVHVLGLWEEHAGIVQQLLEIIIPVFILTGLSACLPCLQEDRRIFFLLHFDTRGLNLT